MCSARRRCVGCAACHGRARAGQGASHAEVSCRCRSSTGANRLEDRSLDGRLSGQGRSHPRRLVGLPRLTLGTPTRSRAVVRQSGQFRMSSRFSSRLAGAARRNAVKGCSRDFGHDEARLVGRATGGVTVDLQQTGGPPPKRSVVATQSSMAAEQGIVYGDAESRGVGRQPERAVQGWADPWRTCGASQEGGNLRCAARRRAARAGRTRAAAARPVSGAGTIGRSRRGSRSLALGAALMRRGRATRYAPDADGGQGVFASSGRRRCGCRHRDLSGRHGLSRDGSTKPRAS